MTDLLTVLPDFDAAAFSHLLPSLERARICTADLLTLDAADVARRAQVPLGEVRKLSAGVVAALHLATSATAGSSGGVSDESTGAWAGGSSVQLLEQSAVISTLDDGLDAALNGGFPTGHVSEITGESAAGKTQLLLTLLLSVQLLPSQRGQPPRSALYISTESPLQTSRLAQILHSHPKLAALAPHARPSLSRIQSTHVHDLEAQDHILRFQVPVAIAKLNVGLLVIDSIAANYRAEFDKPAGAAADGSRRRAGEALARRNAQLAQTGALLRRLARAHGIAVVVANQVADRFSPSANVEPGSFAMNTQASSTQQGGGGPAASQQHVAPPPYAGASDDPLALDHQLRFFSGWGADARVPAHKTPSLGLTWTRQLAARVALLKAPVYDDDAARQAPGVERELVGWTRSCNVVFSAWCRESQTAFEIWEGGVRSIASEGEAAAAVD